MHTFLIALASLAFTFQAAIAAPTADVRTISKRGTAQDVIDDVNDINAGVESLTSHVSSYTSGILLTSIVNGAPILADVADIHLANRKGYLDASTASTFSEADSIAVVETVANTVLTSIPNSVSVLKSKREEFQQALLTPVVLASMELLLYDHDTFSAAVLAKLTLDEATTQLAEQGVAVIHDALVDGIAYYTS